MEPVHGYCRDTSTSKGISCQCLIPKKNWDKYVEEIEEEKIILKEQFLARMAEKVGKKWKFQQFELEDVKYTVDNPPGI